MHGVAARIWNEIAATQPLATGWAQQMFPLPAEELETALAREEAKLVRSRIPAIVAASYLEVMPLYSERIAISRWKAMTDSGIQALPTIESPDEAVALASRDRPLTPWQQTLLRSLLASPPP